MSTPTQILISIIRISAKWILYLILTIMAIAVVIVLSSRDEQHHYNPAELVVNDITQLNPIQVARVIHPKSTAEIVAQIANSSGPISIGGGRYSQGGQTAYPDSLHIDMREMDKVLLLDTERRRITVQAGITWRQLQEHIDPHDLSVKIMQTYANFTVGGSLSVNVHGRYIGEGAVVKSVESIKLLLADGSVVTASREENTALFNGAIGGYGGLGVIVEATLMLVENIKIERTTKAMNISQYKHHFFDGIRDNNNVVLHNADIYPPNYDDVLAVTWIKTDKPLTSKERIMPSDQHYYWAPKAAEFVANYHMGKKIRQSIIDPLYYSQNRVVWRNWEASYDVAELEPASRQHKTYALREYFIPVEKFGDFVPAMKDIFNRNDANIINVSIRHAFPDQETLLSWSRQEVFAFVVYYQQGTDQMARDQVKKWSLEMIDAVISFGGSYYLPYQIFASSSQFAAAYPQSSEYFALKATVDPDNRFTNMLWAQYYRMNRDASAIKKREITEYSESAEKTLLTISE